MSLPPFSLQTEVFAEDAKQDRIHLDWGDWILMGTTEEIDALRNRMGSLLADARQGASVDALRDWGRLFLRPQQRGYFRSALTVRSNLLAIGRERLDPPLFTGRWVFSRYARRDEEQATHTRTHLELWLNPTRYLRHQSPVPMPNPRQRGGWPEAQMFGERLESASNDEIALDGSDNWLPISQRLNRFHSAPYWWRHLSCYLDAIPTTFEEELARLCRVESSLDGGGCRYRVEQKLNLQLVETYWEFTSANPTSLVASLKPLLQAFSHLHRETRVYRYELAEALDHNALSITVQVSAGRELRIYAKTNHRVRVEVIHTLGGRDGFRLAGGHAPEDWEVLLPMLRTLAEDAATLVNEAFAFFSSHNTVTPSHLSAFDLLLGICEHARDFSTATTIASLLVHNGTVVATRTSEEVKGSLHRLSEAGILEYTGQSRKTYVVSEPYRHALQTLQQEGNFSLLTARVRQRTIPR